MIDPNEIESYRKKSWFWDLAVPIFLVLGFGYFLVRVLQSLNVI